MRKLSFIVVFVAVAMLRYCQIETGYVTSDGREFRTEAEADAHLTAIACPAGYMINPNTGGAVCLNPAIQIYTRDQLPTKSWSDLEDLYACNEAERSDPKSNYRWELSLPLKAETPLYHSDPWTAARESSGVYTLNSQAFNAAFEVKSSDYTVTVPDGATVYKIDFTTKNCESDWLYVILPSDRDPLDFKIVVEIK